MLRIECTARQARFLYLAVLGLTLVFVLINWPLIGDALTIAATTRNNFQVVNFIHGQFDLTRESVVATWYSSVLLFTTGGAALLNYTTGPSSGILKWVTRAGWLLTATVLVALSADEIAQVHESLAPLLNSASGETTVQTGAGDWIPILMPLIALVALSLVVFFAVAFRNSRVLMVLGLLGVGCWVGAICTESIEAGFWTMDIDSRLRGFVEESFELLGTTFLFISFVEFNRKHRVLTTQLTRSAETTADGESHHDVHSS